MTSYYQHPFCSNSCLSKLIRENTDEFAEAFRFGTLFHAMILEPHKVDYITQSVLDTNHTYSKCEMDVARKMRDAFLKDIFCRDLLSKSETEVEMYNDETRFSLDGFDFTLNTRRKYDGWIGLVNWGWDLKSTTATTQSEFETSVRQFDYDRARVFYAKGPGAIQDIIIGVSKVAPYKIFKVFMKHGDQLWTQGEMKCNQLAYQYWLSKI